MAPVRLREMTAAEDAAVEKLARSHTAPAQRVQRAQIIWHASRGERASAIAARVGLDGETVRKRIHCRAASSPSGRWMRRGSLALRWGSKRIESDLPRRSRAGARPLAG